MGLFTPIWMTDNEKKLDKACDAAWKMTNRDKLARVAKEAPLFGFANLRKRC